MKRARTNVGKRLSAAMLALASLARAGRVSAAAVEFRTPSNYDSVYDSPWSGPILAPDVGAPTYYLEDFQDGKLNTPGLRIPQYDPGYPSSVVRILDNMGVGWGPDPGTPGRALSSFAMHAAFSNPPIWYNSLDFVFDEAELGFLPTDFGFAWTDDSYGMHFRLTVYDRQHNELGTLTGTGTGAPQLHSLRYDGGIGSVRMWTSKLQHQETELTIDHVQYGDRFTLRLASEATAPEPGSAVLLLLGAVGTGLAWRSRSCRRRCTEVGAGGFAKERLSPFQGFLVQPRTNPGLRPAAPDLPWANFGRPCRGYGSRAVARDPQGQPQSRKTGGKYALLGVGGASLSPPAPQPRHARPHELHQLRGPRHLLPLALGQGLPTLLRRAHLVAEVLDEHLTDPAGHERLHQALQHAPGDRAHAGHGLQE
jgi:hypothetical protein